MTPIYPKENLWKYEGEPTFLAVSANGVLRYDNLVMGAGIAKESLNYFGRVFPGMAADAIRYSPSSKVKTEFPSESIWSYGFLPVCYPCRTSAGYAIFQSKAHYRDDSSKKIIAYSAAKLKEYLDTRPRTTVRMNFPGIGLGHMKREDVMECLDILDERVTVCYVD